MKATKTTLFKITMVAFVGAIIFFACTKEGSVNNGTVPPGKQQVSLYLTDGPAFFDKVLIDIKSVKVLIDTCSKSNEHHDRDDDDTASHCVIWDSLSITPGVYDLLNNSLVKDSVTYPLNLPSSMKSTIVLKLRGGEWDEFQTGHFRLWLDFDALHSIIHVRDNMFVLNPVIHLFIIRASGSISGKITPRAALPVISIYNGTDTAFALPNEGGEFKVRGLNEGTYTVFINASNGYNDTTINNVKVQVGKEDKLGTIALHK